MDDIERKIIQLEAERDVADEAVKDITKEYHHISCDIMTFETETDEPIWDGAILDNGNHTR